MTVSTENAVSPKSTKSRGSDFSVSLGTTSNWDLCWARGGGGALAPQLPRAIRAGPSACGEKSGGLFIRGLSIREFIYTESESLPPRSTNSRKLGPKKFPTLIWTCPDCARQLQRGAPRRRAPLWICTEEFEFPNVANFGGVAFSVESVMLIDVCVNLWSLDTTYMCWSSYMCWSWCVEVDVLKLRQMRYSLLHLECHFFNLESQSII